MDKKNVLGFVKKITAGFLALGIFATGLAVVPREAEATVKDQLIYSTKYDIVKFWEDGKKAPVKEGYVFGGWYKKATQEAERAQLLALDTDETQMLWCVPLKAADIDADSDGKVDDSVKDDAIAKFVPAKVLTVKAQNMAGTDVNTGNTYLRVISSLDSENYRKIGFEIWLENTIQVFNDQYPNAKKPLETNKVYTGLKVGTGAKTANEIFGGVSEYLSVWQLKNINNEKYADIIYVRPYWYTMDGTKVEGMAKYIHIEDDYLDYISVPLNLQTDGLQPAQIAAGEIVATYNQAHFAVASVEGVCQIETGRVLKEMDYRVDQDSGTIALIGNVKEAGNTAADGIYANIRFTKIDTDASNSLLNFAVKEKQFCDWTKKILDQAAVAVQ